MPKITINGKSIDASEDLTLLQACEEAGVEIPRFCYHDRLSIAGNCRMCLVELDKAPELVASCAMGVKEGMVIKTESPKVRTARKGVMEFLLVNHPLDCPICDQGGECDLQDQAIAYGFDHSRFRENKRSVIDKDMGPLIATDMTRCIHCTRCVRFSTEVAGISELGSFGRGEDMEIIPYIEHMMTSELSGNMIDLCPVGALTSKPYSSVARPWELTHTPSIDVMDAVGSAIRIDSRGREVKRILPILNEEVNDEWISDKTRFVYDGLAVQRLDRPYMRRGGRLRATNWASVLSAIAETIRQTDPSKIGALAGNLACAESVMALKDLMLALKVPHLDCRQKSSWTPPSQRSGWLFNSSIDKIYEADAFLLIGTQPRKEAAIISMHIFCRWNQWDEGKELPIGLIGETCDLPYDYEHLAKTPDGLTALKGFEAKLKAAKKPMIILGEAALDHVSGAAIYDNALQLAYRVGAIKDDWRGFNILHHAAGRVGALDLGFLPQKANKEEGIAQGQGVEDILSGKMDIVYLLHNDELDFTKLKNSCVIYQGSHGDKGAQCADFILPSAAWTEQDALWVNMEGRVQEARRALFPPGEARGDWEIIRALMLVLGIDAPYHDLTSLRAEMVKRHPHFAHKGSIVESAMPPEPSKAGQIKKTAFPMIYDNFYLTNPIARASVVMAECAKTTRLMEGESGKNKSKKNGRAKSNRAEKKRVLGVR